MLNHTIKTLDELEFAVFCIENVAARIGKTPKRFISP